MSTAKGLSIIINYLTGTPDSFVLMAGDGSLFHVQPKADDTVSAIKEKVNVRTKSRGGMKIKYTLPLKPTELENEFLKLQLWFVCYVRSVLFIVVCCFLAGYIYSIF
jgi:hypothetical protein